jgi:hypothetical protein
LEPPKRNARVKTGGSALQKRRSAAGGGGGEFGTGMSGASGERIGLAPGLNGLRGAEKRGALNVGNGATAGEGNRDGRGGDALRKFCDDKNVVAAGGEKHRVDGATKIFDRNSNLFITIFGIANQTVPSLCGVADLVKEIGHEELL